MTATTRPGSPLDRLDRRVTTLLADHGLTALRIALGIVFLWFGALKFFPGMSPAEDLAARTIDVLTFGIVPPEIALPRVGYLRLPEYSGDTDLNGPSMERLPS